MTNLLTQAERDELRRRHKLARDVVADLCEGKRKWIMRIPADPSEDPDLVICASLADTPKLLNALDEADKRIAELQRTNDNLRCKLSASRGEADFYQTAHSEVCKQIAEYEAEREEIRQAAFSLAGIDKP